MDLRRMVEHDEPNFDPACNLLASVWHSPGYHSRIPSGERVHETRRSIYYALTLLALGDSRYLPRAGAVIRRVLSSQVTDPYDPAFGIWPWLDEEPVGRMAPPDWNWADFIGSGLCHILCEYSDRVDAGLADAMREALRRAAWSIFRRNVQPNYTNIAIMGAAVTGAAGEILGEPLLLAYARRRLRRFVDYTRETGGLNEYNSPCYTFIALFEVERILQLVVDPELTATAEELFRLIWGEIAAHFHPATGQLGGAQSRAYTEYLSPENAAFLSEATGVEIHPAKTADGKEFASGGIRFDGLRHRPCPPELIGRFRALPEPEIELTQRLVKREPDSRSTRGTTYLTADLVIGSVSDNCFWVQCRPLLGYWKSGEGSPAMFRLRFLKDGVDFASASLVAAQRRNRILCGIGLVSNLGDYHVTLDRPADGRFAFRRLAARFDLAGPGAVATELPGGRIALGSGGYLAVITPGAGRFGARPVHLETGGDAGRAWVDLVLCDGESQTIAFTPDLVAAAVAGIEILPVGAVAVAPPPAVCENGGRVTAAWEGLAVDFSLHPVPRD